METRCDKPETVSLAATLAPEDLRCGDYVAVLNEIVEIRPCFWMPSEISSSGMPQRIQYRPVKPSPPLRVEAVCLPFVFVKAPDGRFRTLDVRQSQLARIDHNYAQTVWRSIRPRGSA